MSLLPLKFEWLEHVNSRIQAVIAIEMSAGIKKKKGKRKTKSSQRDPANFTSHPNKPVVSLLGKGARVRI